MDAFYASVEMRDDPSLIGKPVIIGAPPDTRGVVSTCNYEARKYGVHSAMNIKEAYRLCPDGVFLTPDFRKYHAVSDQIHAIWEEYAGAMEAIALDEAYLDVTETAGTFDRARGFAHEIKKRVLDETGLSCSVGLAYSKVAAKTASEENKPNGYFEILTAEDFVNLMMDRDVRDIYTVGVKTAEKLHAAGIHTMRDIRENSSDVISMLGKHGQMIVDLAYGHDDSRVVAYRPEDAKSISRELTFQEDVFDFWLLADVLLLLSVSVVNRARSYGLCGNGVSLKVTYSDMKGVTRSKVVKYCDDPITVHREAVSMLEEVSTRPIRLIGVGVYNVTPARAKQMTLDQMAGGKDSDTELDRALEALSKRYKMEPVKGGDIGWDNLHSLAEHMRTHRGQRGSDYTIYRIEQVGLERVLSDRDGIQIVSGHHPSDDLFLIAPLFFDMDVHHVRAPHGEKQRVGPNTDRHQEHMGPQTAHLDPGDHLLQYGLFIQERIAERMHEPNLDGIHCAHLVEDVYVSDAEVDQDEEDHDQFEDRQMLSEPHDGLHDIGGHQHHERCEHVSVEPRVHQTLHIPVQGFHGNGVHALTLGIFQKRPHPFHVPLVMADHRPGHDESEEGHKNGHEQHVCVDVHYSEFNPVIEVQRDQLIEYETRYAYHSEQHHNDREYGVSATPVEYAVKESVGPGRNHAV